MKLLKVSPHTQHIETSLYDKRDYELHMLPPKQYVHIHSDAPLWCKQNILYTQMLSAIRFSSLSRYHSCLVECHRVYLRMLRADHCPQDLQLLVRKAARKAADKFAIPFRCTLADFQCFSGLDLWL